MKNIVTILSAILLISCNSNNTIEIATEGKSIIIKGDLNGSNLSEVEIQLKSSRNNHISHYNEVSAANPDYDNTLKSFMERDYNIFYPVVDIATTENMHGVASFDGSINSNYSINGMFFQKVYQINGDNIHIPSHQLIDWENNIYIQPTSQKMSAFYLTETVPVTDGKLDATYKLLSETWSGVVSIINPSDKNIIYTDTVASVEKPENSSILAQFEHNDLSRERLTASLTATLHFTMGCQNTSSDDVIKGGLNLFYDLESKTYRRPTWIWGQGPSIKILLESAKIPEVTAVIPADKLKQTAIEVGESSLKFQIKDESSPAYGIILSRWSENRGTLNTNYGFEEYYSIADAQFLAGWGWIPLYIETGDERFLEGVKLLTYVTDKLTQEFDIIPMDYMVRAAEWKNYCLNEQGFGTEGINELNKVDPNPEYQRIGDDYMQMLLKIFDTEEGIWNRSYRIREDVVNPSKYHTRGTGWAMEGLVALYELTQDQVYLDKAKKMADYFINYQLDNGGWSYDFKSMDDDEISEKGTALWSVLLYKTYRHTKEEKYLESARKALLWCLNNQTMDTDDMHAYGGLVGVTRQSGVIYRHYFPLACIYTSGFFGMSVIEELAVQNNQ